MAAKYVKLPLNSFHRNTSLSTGPTFCDSPQKHLTLSGTAFVASSLFNVWPCETKWLRFQRNVEEEFDLFQKIFTIVDNGFLQFKKGFNVLLHARRGDRLKFVFDQGFLVGNFGRWRQGHWCGRIEKLRHVESVLHLLAEHAFGFLDV